MKRWDIVLAYWVDSGGIGRWTDTEVALANIKESTHCWTVGFYFGESDECISIASCASTSDQVDHIMFIPKVALVKLELLKKASEK